MEYVLEYWLDGGVGCGTWTGTLTEYVLAYWLDGGTGLGIMANHK